MGVTERLTPQPVRRRARRPERSGAQNPDSPVLRLIGEPAEQSRLADARLSRAEHHPKAPGKRLIERRVQPRKLARAPEQWLARIPPGRHHIVIR